MKKIIFTLTCILLCGCTLEEDYTLEFSKCQPITNKAFFKGKWNATHDNVTTANNQFAINLLKTITKRDTENKNILFSPYSAQLALAMTANGADGETLSEIMDVLGFTDTDLQAMNEYNSMVQKVLKDADPYSKFQSANGLWTDSQFNIKDDFRSTLLCYYDAQSESLDFKSGKAESIINNWISNQTKGLVKDLISEGYLSDAAAVIANALYFKGPWTNPMHIDNTTIPAFKNYDKTKSKVDMIGADAPFAVSIVNQGRILSMPFANKVYSFDILLPDYGVDINSFIEELNLESLPLLSLQNIKTSYEVLIPKFQEEVSLELKEYLNDMGMNKAFIPCVADLSRLSDTPTCIADVNQKTIIKVNEEGAEAASATEVKEVYYSYTGSVNQFYVNTPFIYMIRDHLTGTILFMGRVMKL